MANVKDVSSGYDVQVTHEISQLLENMTVLLKSKKDAQMVITKIFGGTSFHPSTDVGSALRIWLEMGFDMGLSESKVAMLNAALGIGRTMYVAPPSKLNISDPQTVASHFIPLIGHSPKEIFSVLILNVRNDVIAVENISIGSATETIAHPREIFGVAVRYGGSRIILAHNHPTGHIDPSSEDLALTEQLIKSGNIMGIPVLDHLVIGGNKWCSIRETTNLWTKF